MDKNTELANKIYENIGGMENVEKLVHCMTRVRVTIKDYSKINLDNLRKTDGVLGVVEDDTLQIIIGPGRVNKIANIMVEMAGVGLGEEFSNSDTSESLEDIVQKEKQKQKNNIKPSKIKNFFKIIANIFVPLIPALVGAGIVGGIGSVFTNLITSHVITGDFWVTFTSVLGIISKGLFTYLAIYTGINAAKEFGATPALGGIIGGITLLPGITEDNALKNIFTGEALTVGQGGILGVIFAVWILGVIEKYLHKYMYEAIDIIVTPTISLLLVGSLTLFLIMPFAGVVSDSLVGAIIFVLKLGGPIAGFILASLFLPMVMLGLHQVLIPIHMEMIAKTHETLLLPILSMGGAGQVGAAFALWIGLKNNKKLTNMIKGALPAGILGVGEPLIYGITLPLGRPFITACLGGGIGGAFIAYFQNVGASAVGPSGAALIPLITNNKWLEYIIGLLISYLFGFIFTYFWGIPKDAHEKI